MHSTNLKGGHTHTVAACWVDLRRDGDRLITHFLIPHIYFILFRRTLEHRQARVMTNYGRIQQLLGTWVTGSCRCAYQSGV